MDEQLPATLLEASIWTGKLFSGEWRASIREANITEPATGGSLGSIGMADAGLIGEAAALARQAQVPWAAQHHEELAAIIRRAARLAEHYFDEIVGWFNRKSGSTQAKAAFEASVSGRVLHEYTGLPSRSIGEVLPSVPGRLSLARRRPLGVVGVISPFNFPLCLAMRAVAPALALGNAVVLKPDPSTSVCGGFVIARLFELSGLPAGVLHVLPGARWERRRGGI